MRGRPFPPEKVGPKLRRYALAKAWDEIRAQATIDAERIFCGLPLEPPK